MDRWKETASNISDALFWGGDGGSWPLWWRDFYKDRHFVVLKIYNFLLSQNKSLLVVCIFSLISLLGFAPITVVYELFKVAYMLREILTSAVKRGFKKFQGRMFNLHLFLFFFSKNYISPKVTYSRFFLKSNKWQKQSCSIYVEKGWRERMENEKPKNLKINFISIYH